LDRIFRYRLMPGSPAAEHGAAEQQRLDRGDELGQRLLGVARSRAFPEADLRIVRCRRGQRMKMKMGGGVQGIRATAQSFMISAAVGRGWGSLSARQCANDTTPGGSSSSPSKNWAICFRLRGQSVPCWPEAISAMCLSVTYSFVAVAITR